MGVAAMLAWSATREDRIVGEFWSRNTACAVINTRSVKRAGQNRINQRRRTNKETKALGHSI